MSFPLKLCIFVTHLRSMHPTVCLTNILTSPECQPLQTYYPVLRQYEIMLQISVVPNVWGGPGHGVGVTATGLGLRENQNENRLLVKLSITVFLQHSSLQPTYLVMSL